MTKKDFELIASVLKYRIITLDDNTSVKILVNDFAKNLEDLYQRFNREKFLRACGVVVENERIKTCVNCWAITKTSLKNWHCANCGIDN